MYVERLKDLKSFFLQFEEEGSAETRPIYTKALFWKFLIPFMITVLLSAYGLLSLMFAPRKV